MMKRALLPVDKLIIMEMLMQKVEVLILLKIMKPFDC